MKTTTNSRSSAQNNDQHIDINPCKFRPYISSHCFFDVESFLNSFWPPRNEATPLVGTDGPQEHPPQDVATPRIVKGFIVATLKVAKQIDSPAPHGKYPHHLKNAWVRDVPTQAPQQLIGIDGIHSAWRGGGPLLGTNKKDYKNILKNKLN